MPILVTVPPARVSPAVDTLGETIRGVVQKSRASMVTVSLVLKYNMGGQSQDSELETEGVVLTSEGLVAIMNASIDPVAMMGGDSDAGKFSVKVVSARILLEDGQEVPAKVVLRDPDKGIAFLRPITPVGKPLAFVDMKKPPIAQVGDPLVVLGRLGKGANRAPRVITPRIIGVIEKPRTLYVAETFSGLLALGDVVFNEKGEALGIITLRSKMETTTRTTMDMSRGMMPVVVPGDDIWEAASQAPSVKDAKDDTPAGKTPSKPATPPKKPTTPPKKSGK